MKGKNKDRLSQFHQDDPQVSVDELWGTWRLSEVHNWTVDQVCVGDVVIYYCTKLWPDTPLDFQ